MKCLICDKQNRPGATICEYCGQPLINLSDASRYKTGRLDTIEIPWKPYVAPPEPRERPGTGLLHDSPFITLEVADTGQRLHIKSQGHVSLGRSDADSDWQPTVDLTPYGAVENGVSRVHADLFFENDQVFLLELGSANGTRVNGAAVQMGLARQLYNGDELEFGRLRMRISFS